MDGNELLAMLTAAPAAGWAKGTQVTRVAKVRMRWNAERSAWDFEPPQGVTDYFEPRELLPVARPPPRSRRRQFN